MAARKITVEVWKPIPGHEGYEASDCGRIRSIGRKVFGKTKWGGYGWRTYKGRVLKPQKRKADQDHLCVRLGQVNARFVHQLVMLAFVGPPPAGLIVLHHDDDPTNNRLSNLRYGTHVDNEADKDRHGRVSWGESRPAAKLTEADVREIRKSERGFYELARQYGVAASTIWQVRSGRSWKRVK